MPFLFRAASAGPGEENATAAESASAAPARIARAPAPVVASTSEARADDDAAAGRAAAATRRDDPRADAGARGRATRSCRALAETANILGGVRAGGRWV